MRNFRSYDFWIDSKNLTKDIYILLRKFPSEERFALCDQLRRSAVSIPSNIAEGAGRTGESDFSHFLDFAIGSAYEVETQIEISRDLGYISEFEYSSILNRLQSIERRITAFKKTLIK